MCVSVCVPLSKLPAYEENECITFERIEEKKITAIVNWNACVLYIFAVPSKRRAKEAHMLRPKPNWTKRTHWTERKSPFATLTNIRGRFCTKKKEKIRMYSCWTAVIVILVHTLLTQFVCLLILTIIIIVEYTLRKYVFAWAVDENGI